MIRRQSEAGYFHLIRQDDHARLSGELARRFGNGRFQRPDGRAVLGTESHDAGWPIHDDAPTLNDGGLPRDVFESNREIALPVWTASSERAEAADPYAGLLVSLHGLSLSVYATSQASMKHEKFDVGQMKEKFLVNQFQHGEVVRQERLRKALRMRDDLPLTYGLAAAGVDEREDRLRFDFRLLQAMDMLSLAICCTEPPAATTQEVHLRPGGEAVKLGLRRAGADLLVVDPWPFEEKRMEFEVPARRVEGRAYESVEAFREAYDRAGVELLKVTIAAVGVV
jgi:hypothetical protein